MKTIISCSRRTDIPAFHTDWLLRRIHAGYCRVPNPHNPAGRSRVSLRPEDVAAIVFWTKNPAPLMPHLEELDRRGYRYVFLFTLNGYGRQIEAGVPDLDQGLRVFQDLSRRIGAERIVWRYDPILLSSKTDVDYHRRMFARIASGLRGHTKRVILSLVDFYVKAEPGFRLLERQGFVFERDAAQGDALKRLIPALAETAGQAGMSIQSCAETAGWDALGVPAGKCIDDAWLRHIFGIRVTMARDRSQRAACRCVRSRDIGVYDTCGAGCRYCYATSFRPEDDARTEPCG